MIKACTAPIAMAMAMATLLFAGCGLKGDLYIAADKPEAAPADGLSTENKSMESQSTDIESTEEKTDQSVEPAP